MKLARFGDRNGAKTPCIMDDNGAQRDVSSIVSDFAPETISRDLFDALRTIDIKPLPLFEKSDTRTAPPVAQPRNIWCVGLNYSDHAAEAGLPVPAEPILFNKSSATYCGPDDPIYWSEQMTKLDWVLSRRSLLNWKELLDEHL